MRYSLLLTRLPLAAAAAGLLALAVPAASSASGYNCDASAGRLSVLGQPAIEPVTANRGAASCVTQNKSVSSAQLGLPSPLIVAPLAAETSDTGTGASEKATATGGLLSLSVGSAPGLPVALPTAQIGAALAAVPVSGIPAPLQTALAGIPGVGALSLDLVPALQALSTGQLPNVNLLNIQGATASVTGACVSGKPAVTGTTNVGSISVLGQTVQLGNGIDSSGTLIDTANLSPASITNYSLIQIPGTSLSLAQLQAQLQALPGGAALSDTLGTLVQSTLAALPPISIPATLARVQITRGVPATVNGKLTEQALNLNVSIAGQPVVSGVVGEATASVGSATCGAAAAAALQCTTRRLVLTNVHQDGDRVKLQGAADPRYIGKTVDITFVHTGKVVAHAKIDKNANFSTTAAMPSKKIAGTNLARYVAKLGKEKSLPLKLTRRMILTSTTSKNGKVTISGRIVRPLGSPVRTITLSRRVSCKKTEVVGHFKPKSDGTFKITVPNPKGTGGAAVYRLGTQVRKHTSNPKLFPTFTLPTAVNLSS